MIEKNEKNEQSKKKVDLSWLKKKRTLPVWMFILAAVYLMALGFHFGKAVIAGFGYRNAIVTKPSLKKVLKISELSVLEYTYNAVATGYDDNGKVKYYVAYEGTVTAEIDFSKIDISIDRKEKQIILSIPDPHFHEITVALESIDPNIFRRKDDNIRVLPEMYKTCQDDLERRILNDTDILAMAKESAVTQVRDFVEIWVQQISGEKYQIVIH